MFVPCFAKTFKLAIALYYSRTIPFSLFDIFRTYSERLWTDYERLNQTHFWSETAKVWWTSKNNSQFMNYDDRYTDFDNHVSIDGYEQIKNIAPTDGATCVCVGSCSLIAFVRTGRTIIERFRESPTN